MAKTVRDFVKNSLNSYYKNFQVKMGANADPSIDNVHNAIRIANDGSIYIHDAGGFNGYDDNMQNASTLQDLLKHQGGGSFDELIAGNALNIDANSIIQIGYIQRNETANLTEMRNIKKFHSIDNSDLSKNAYQYKIVPEEKDIPEITKTIRIEHFANFELYGDLNGETLLGIVKDAANGDGKIIAISLQNPSELIPSKTDNPAFIPCYCKKYNLADDKKVIYVTSHLYNASLNNYTFGSDNFNYAQNANIEGVRNYIDENATGSHAEGYYNTINSTYSHAEGYNTSTNGDYSHAEGYRTNTNGDYSHAEGFNTSTFGDYSHTEGFNTTTFGDYSHAEGYNTSTFGDYSHAEGEETHAYGQASHAEGERTMASGYVSHAEGCNTMATQAYTHAEGNETTASGENSHAEGYRTSANGDYSHAEGYSTTASGINSHVEGVLTIANNDNEHAEGKFNYSHTGVNPIEKTIHSIGIGTHNKNRKNAFEVMQDGSIYVYGIGNYDGSILTNASTLQDVIKNSNDNVEELNTNINILNTSVNNLDLDIDTLKANVLNISINIERYNDNPNVIVISDINVNVEDPNWTLSEYKEMFEDIDNNHNNANVWLPNVYGVVCPVYITIKEKKLIILKQYGTMRTHTIFDQNNNIYTYVRDITCRCFCSYDVENNQIIEHYFKFSAKLENNSKFISIVKFNDKRIWNADILICNNFISQ